MIQRAQRAKTKRFYMLLLQTGRSMTTPFARMIDHTRASRVVEANGRIDAKIRRRLCETIKMTRIKFPQAAVVGCGSLPPAKT
jgi:hypothetical protein